ncbi:MAG: glucose-1-phosphate adenylyltransferase subunit GlgD [Clostridiales Family XIII bacterium]|jgi:glucose-1-phosphate adenylyltransferase|nr:glucose-1-phosphate adenylyltransferase subunit GlgD [Clostridiales Family XIII bacterium]
MIGEALGIIFAGQQVFNLRELVDKRAVGALPIAGRYRVIDFVLSNMVNSGIRNVAVITGRNYNSLMDHLASGKSWDLSRKSDGLFLMPPFSLAGNPGTYRGFVEALKASMDYIMRAKQEYCIMSGSFTVYTMNYEEALHYHIEKGADVTVLYNRLSAEPYRGERYDDVRFRIGRQGTVTQVEHDLSATASDCLSMDTYIIRKDILACLVDECISRGEYHFAAHLIGGNLDRLKVMAWEHKGYVGRMHNVAAYYSVNMDMLKADVRTMLFDTDNHIYTKIKDEVPARYLPTAQVRGSLVANGCIIEGEVENSVLFRGVYVGKGTTVRNSIILPGTETGDNAELDYVILDKNVVVRNRTRLVGNEQFPMVIRKGAVV